MPVVEKIDIIVLAGGEEVSCHGAERTSLSILDGCWLTARKSDMKERRAKQTIMDQVSRDHSDERFFWW